MGERLPVVVKRTVEIDLGDFGAEFEGVFINVRRPTVGRQFAWHDLINRQTETPEDDESQAEDILAFLGRELVSWNLTDEDGEPFAANEDGLSMMEPSFIKAFGAAYTAKMARVPVPLAKRSTGGERFPEASIPMEISSSPPPS